MENKETSNKNEIPQQVEMSEIGGNEEQSDDSRVRIISRRKDNPTEPKKNEENNYRNSEENLKLNVNNGDTSQENQTKKIPIPIAEGRRNSFEKLKEDEDVLGKMILDVDKGFLVKEKEYDGSANDDLEDQEIFLKLENEVRLQHPIKYYKDGRYQSFEVCNSEAGLLGCGEKQAKSDLDSLGLGMMLYFKIVKAFAIIFFIIVIFNTPLYYFYSINHKEFQVKSYQDVLFKTTIGNVGSSLKNCIKTPVDDIFKKNQHTFNLNCNSYYITKAVSFGLTNIYNKSIDNEINCQSFSTYVNITTDSKCSFENYINKYIADSCVNKVSCDVKVDLNEIKKNCTEYFTDDFFYLVYDCFDPWVYAGYDYIKRTNFSFIVVGIDLLSMMTLLISLIVISIAQRRAERYYKENVVSLSDYTINFQDLNIDQDKIYSELDNFLKHIYKVAKIENPQFNENMIYDINYPVITNHKLDLILEKNNLTQYINAKKTEINKNEKKYSASKLEKLNKNLALMREKEETLRDKIEKYNVEHLKKVNDLYITFTSQSYKNKIIKAYNRGCCTRCCIIFCCMTKTIKHLYYKGKWLNYQPTTDEPSNIKWENVPYSVAKRKLRKVVSFFVASIIILASFGIVIGNKYAQNAINQVFNTNVDCNYINYTEKEVYTEFTDESINSRSKVKTFCFCQNTLFSLGYSDTLSKTVGTSDTYPCKEWVSLYLYSRSLMVATFILVPTINAILSILLSLLTAWERNKSVSQYESSNMWKSFFLQFINTAVVILVVNTYIQSVYEWNSSFPLFTGLFKDLNPYWYLYVGVTIIFCLILNIFTPHVAPLIYYLLSSTKRCCDRKCCNNGKRTKKVTRQEYLGLYIGPNFDIGTRYSQMLSTIFVTLVYSSGMPILYLCCCLFFFVTYWVDKCLILKFYKNPPRIDLYISRLFDLIIIFAIIVHYGFGIWTYGDSNILTDNSETAIKAVSDWVKNLFTTNDSFAKEILTRITYSHNVICFAFLLIVVLYFIFKLFFVGLIMDKLCKCFDYDYIYVKDVDIYDAIKIKGLYSNHQLRKAQYFKMRKSDGNSETLQNTYFRNMINEDRKNLKRRIGVLVSQNMNQIENKNFDNEFPLIMKNFNFEETALINRDYSYNISYIPVFRDAAYYEFITPYLNKDK